MRHATRTLLTSSLLAFLFTVHVPAQQPPAAKTDAERFAGAWVFDEAELGKVGQLGRVWSSVVTVGGDSFTLSKFLGSTKDLKATFAFVPNDPKAVDLKLHEFDMSDLGVPMKIPAATLPAIYKLDGDRLALCFPRTLDGKRPATFETNSDTYEVTLVRAPTGFKEFPKEITVRVTGPDGKPAPGVTLTGFMDRRTNREKKDAPPEWNYYQSVRTGPDGSATVKAEQTRFGQFVLRDTENKRMAVVPLSPAKLIGGEVKAALAPECRVTGKIACEELTKLGRPIGWTNVYLMHSGGRLAGCDSPEGHFEFFVPPGKYTLHAYGSEVEGKDVPITVPPERAEMTADITLTATRLALLKGQPAPELEGVVGWKGKPVKLADLKGNYVLLEFWGYWCGPCVASMPVLIDLHEKYGDKGLVIVGVHLDGDGEVDTAAKLDEKIAGYKKELWEGKDVPFPNALVSGKRQGEGENRRPGGAPYQYGVQAYPTCILIDREGKVVGQFHARDIKAASAEVEKLLAGKK
jgi:uncharacterized protein (TIGR03067 family)